MFVRRIAALSRNQKAAILTATDTALVPLALFSALALQGAEGFKPNWIGIVLMPLAAGMVAATGLPQVRLRDYQGGALLRSALVSVVLGLCAAVLMHDESAVPVTFALVHFVACFGARQAMLRLLTELYLRSPAFVRVAIYGAGRTGIALAREMRADGPAIVHAFLDDNATLAGLSLSGLPIHPGARAEKVIARYRIDRVILAMPSLPAARRSLLVRRFQQLGVEVQVLSAGSHPRRGNMADLLQRAPLEVMPAREGAAYRGASVLISGAGGSIGAELCRQVIACAPAKLVLFELSEFALYSILSEMQALAATGTEIVPVLGSVADTGLVAQVFDRHRVEVVLHAAAYKHVPLVEANPRTGLANNVLGTAVLARAARVAGVRRFVLVSSDKAVRPGNLMGASKRLAEMIVQDLATRAAGTAFSIVRFGNVLGSSGSVVPLFREQIARGGPVTLTDPRVTRYFMTIEEAAQLVLRAGAFAAGGEVYALDMGAPVRIEDLARQMIVAAGCTVRDTTQPEGDIEIVTTGLRPGEKLHEELTSHGLAEPTAHPKILRLCEDHPSEIETAAALRDLRGAVAGGRDDDVIAVVARVVPDYAPQGLPEAAPQCRFARTSRALRMPAE